MLPWFELGLPPQLPSYAWARAVHRLVVSNSLGFLWYNLGQLAVIPRLKRMVKQRFTDIGKQQWSADLAAIDATSSKLGLLKVIKRSHVLEPYLSLLPHKVRVALTKLRVSGHKLRVETGRYSRPVIPRDQRICVRCDSARVDDECHFLADCTAPPVVAARALLLAEAARGTGYPAWDGNFALDNLSLLFRSSNQPLLICLGNMAILACEV
jgi:hypothetical protein